jgi:type I restriction enzyme S subunit
MIFYKETDFRETPVGKIPKDWELRRLGEMCIKITDGTHKTPKFVDKGIPFLSTQNIIPFRRGFDFSEYEKYITREEHEELIKRCKPEKGDILVSKCGTIGRAKLIDVDYEFSIFVGLALLKLKKDLVSGEFLEQMLNYDPCRLRMEVCSPGSTRKTLTIHAIERLEVPFPPVEEQRAIAGVLGVVDSVIAKTDEVIAKTERLKKGLMQTLLTRGIGHKEFKETEIGKIPKTWEVTKLGNKELAEIIMGQSPPSSTYNKEGNGLPFLQGKMEFGEIYPSPILYCSQPIKIAEQNDILISVRAPVGDVNVAPYRLCIGRGLASIRFNSKKADSWFYFYYLRKIKNFLENIGKGSTFKAITKEDLEDLKIPYPPLFEQKKIAQILLTVDRKLEFERNEKVRLERIKRGLMDLLLTGKVRVKVE